MWSSLSRSGPGGMLSSRFGRYQKQTLLCSGWNNTWNMWNYKAMSSNNYWNHSEFFIFKYVESSQKHGTYLSFEDKLNVCSSLQLVVKVLCIFQAVVDLCFKTLRTLQRMYLIFALSIRNEKKKVFGWLCFKA